ncbi:MAG: GNAT family N-acetyltransferase [Sphingobium sp.]
MQEVKHRHQCRARRRKDARSACAATIREEAHALGYKRAMVDQMPAPSALVRMSPTDVAALVSLYVRCTDYFLLQDGVTPTLRDARGLFTDLPPGKVAQDQAVFGWKEDGFLYAVAAILRDYPTQNIWYLGFMIVDPRWRGRGVGASFYRKLEAWAVAEGATELRVAVIEDNEPGARFWRALGFVEARRVGPDRFKTRRHRRIELRLSVAPATPDG